MFSEKSKGRFARRDMNGVMTTLFTQAIENCPDITYAKIIEHMNLKINDMNAQGGYLKRQIKRLFNTMLLQVTSSIYYIIYYYCYCYYY